MKEKVHVVGHKNPDTDSVVSAIVFSDYLKKKKISATPVAAGKLNKETSFVLSFLKEKNPTILLSAGDKKIFMVDHGNLEESVKGLKNSSIYGVLDHHKMSGITTDNPIFYRSEPLGSTSTLVYKMFSESKIKLTQKQASLLLCGVVSDTLNFNSSTTTKEDKIVSQRLAKLSKLKINDLAEKMFKAKSDISGMKSKDIILSDYKEYVFSKAKIGFGVYETVDFSLINEIKKKLIKELKKIKKEKKLDLIFFVSVDILNKNSFFYIESWKEKEIIQKCFKGKLKEEGIIKIKGMVSRKKEMIPPLSKKLN